MQRAEFLVNINGVMGRNKVMYHCMFEGAIPVLSCRVLVKGIAVSVSGTAVQIRTQAVQNSRHSTAICFVNIQRDGRRVKSISGDIVPVSSETSPLC